MANEKSILYDLLIAFAGRRVSYDANKCEFPASRPAVDISAYEDVADRYGKGPQGSKIAISGAGSDAEWKFLQQLADNTEPAPEEPILFFLERARTIGTGAAFCAAQLASFKIGGARAALKMFELAIESQSRIHQGKVLYHNVGAAALTGAGNASAGVNFGALTAGHLFAACLQVVDPPGVVGTTPTFVGRIESDDNSGFTSATTRATFSSLATKGGLLIEIDGDSTPISDTWWRFAWAAPGGTLPQFTVMAAGALTVKT